MAESVISNKDSFDDATKVGFFVKSIVRLSCNMVTEAAQGSDIQARVLFMATESSSLMGYLADCNEHDIIFPFLIFLYNSMVNQSQLRALFVVGDPSHGPSGLGLTTLVKVFCRLGKKAT